MKNSALSRRKFIGTAAAATAAVSFMPFGISCSTGSKKPNSKVGGVQLGVTTYSYRLMPHSAEEVLGYMVAAGISSAEMRLVLEESLGIPQMPPRPARDASEEEKAAYAKLVEETREKQKQWRLSLPMERYEEIGKMYKDAGVKIHIAKFAPTSWSDEEIDYAYKAAKILGAYGISDELNDQSAQRLGQFAEKHKSLALLHTHGQFGQPGFDIDKYLAYSPANMLNLDAGHFYGATGLHPNTILEKYHTRIPSIHMKDKTGPNHAEPDSNRPFGEGEVPIADILLLLKKEKWPRSEERRGG